MILRRFNLDDIDKCNTLEDVFEMMGIGMKEDSKQDLNIRNKEVFGNRAYYNNMIMNDATFNRIYEHLKPLGTKRKNKSGNYMPSEAALLWMNYSPVSNGPRFKQVSEIAGGIPEDILVIITPDDSIYIEDPNLPKEEE